MSPPRRAPIARSRPESSDQCKPPLKEKVSRSEPETLNRPSSRLQSTDVSETTPSRGWF